MMFGPTSTRATSAYSLRLKNGSTTEPRIIGRAESSASPGGRGDAFGPLSWRHEVWHPLSLGRGRRRQRLVADAVFTYVRVDGDDALSVAPRFIELDRATLAVDALAAELARYADLYRAEGRNGEPIWRGLYPVFPPVLCILAGESRPVLERRRRSEER